MIRRSTLILLLVTLVLAASGCKSKKKAMEATSQVPAAMENKEDALAKQRDEERKKAETEAAARRAEEAKRTATYSKLDQYFSAIANAGSVTSANSSIQEALTMFTSPQTPVLIIIHQSGDQKDYDRPTTIGEYLNYLKDQKKSMNHVQDLKFDSSGKITEVELVK